MIITPMVYVNAIADNLKQNFIMNTETVTVHQKGDGFEIIVQHDQTGSAYGIDLSKDAYEQLRLHFVVGQSKQLVCDVCGSTYVIEAPHMGFNCNHCHPL